MKTEQIINLMDDMNISIGSDTETHEDAKNAETHTFSVDLEDFGYDDGEEYLSDIEEAINDLDFNVSWEDSTMFTVYPMN